jgi:CBS domain-containing protein
MTTVKKLLQNKPTQAIWSVLPDATVYDTLLFMAEKNIGAVLVMKDERLVGIFSERDYARKGIIHGRKAKTTPISEVMTPNVITVSTDMTIQNCMQIFSDKKFRHLPVMDEGTVVGVLSIGDIVTSMIQEQRNHIQFLEQYIAN